MSGGVEVRSTNRGDHQHGNSGEESGSLGELSLLDKSVIYQVPASAMAKLSVAERTTARACAVRLGIRYRTVKSQTSMANTD
jgi:hypothetical protein